MAAISESMLKSGPGRSDRTASTELTELSHLHGPAGPRLYTADFSFLSDLACNCEATSRFVGCADVDCNYLRGKGYDLSLTD